MTLFIYNRGCPLTKLARDWKCHLRKPTEFNDNSEVFLHSAIAEKGRRLGSKAALALC